MAEYVLTQIDDYNDKLDLLLAQFQDSENMAGIISASYDKANDMETALFEIRDEMDLDSAVGAQLDILGRVFNLDRDGASDDDYRISLKLKASSEYSGEPEAVISIVKSSFGASFVEYFPEYPGKYYIYTDLDDLSYTSLESISPTGVGVQNNVDLITEDGELIITEDSEQIIVAT